MTWPLHQMTRHDMTCHATPQPTTVAHPTSPHNQPHYCISPRKQVTLPPWNSRKLVHSKEMVWAWRWSVALRTFYRQSLSLLYSFFLLKLPPPAHPGTTCRHRVPSYIDIIKYWYYQHNWEDLMEDKDASNQASTSSSFLVSKCFKVIVDNNTWLKIPNIFCLSSTILPHKCRQWWRSKSRFEMHPLSSSCTKFRWRIRWCLGLLSRLLPLSQLKCITYRNRALKNIILYCFLGLKCFHSWFNLFITSATSQIPWPACKLEVFWDAWFSWSQAASGKILEFRCVQRAFRTHHASTASRSAPYQLYTGICCSLVAREMILLEAWYDLEG